MVAAIVLMSDEVAKSGSCYLFYDGSWNGEKW